MPEGENYKPDIGTTTGGGSTTLTPRTSMPGLSSLTQSHIEGALTDEYLRVSRLIQIALMAAPALFALVVIVAFISTRATQPSQSTFDFYNIITALQIVATLGAIFFATFRFNKTFSVREFSGADQMDTQELASQVAARLRTATLIRNAIYEGTAFFGVAVCMIGVQNGILAAEPMYWVNLSSVAVWLLYGVATLPTKDRLVSIIQAKLQSS